MELQHELQRIDLDEIPFRASLPLIQLDNIEKLLLKKLGSHSKGSEKFPIEKMKNLITSGNLIGKAFLPAGAGGIFGLIAFLAAAGIIKIAKHAHKTALNNALYDGIDNSTRHIREHSFEQGINAIKFALAQAEKYTHHGAYTLFKISKQHKQLIAELKILLKYNLAIAYYQSFITQYKENKGGREKLEEAIHWLIEAENDIEKLSLRTNGYIRKCSSELLLHSAALANNDACDASERGDAKEAKSFLASAIFQSGYIGYEYRDLLRKEASPTEPDAIKIRRIIKLNWETAKTGPAYANEYRYNK